MSLSLIRYAEDYLKSVDTCSRNEGLLQSTERLGKSKERQLSNGLVKNVEEALMVLRTRESECERLRKRLVRSWAKRDKARKLLVDKIAREKRKLSRADERGAMEGVRVR